MKIEVSIADSILRDSCLTPSDIENVVREGVPSLIKMATRKKRLDQELGAGVSVETIEA